LRASNKDAAQQNTHCSNQSEDSQSKLCPAGDVDEQLRFLSQRFRIRIPIRQDQIAVRVLIEVNQRTLLLLPGRRWWYATRHGDGLGVEMVLGGIHHRFPLGVVEVGLPAARHVCEEVNVRIEGLLHTTVG
jgi:hypothetical protein